MTAITAWPGRAETWLDERGKGAWIAAMILGFVFFWPAGLALLAYMIWSKRMFGKSCRHAGHHDFRAGRGYGYRHGFRSSGNSAFDAYKADTIERLEREQAEFEAFLGRLRAARDKAEFDDYMAERARDAARGEGSTKDDSGPSGPEGSPRGGY